MSVYVDDMKASFGRMVMCHMIADTREELLAMASTIGVAHKWIQKPDEPGEHFDICLSMRAKAVEAGAVEITQRELGIKIKERRPVQHKEKEDFRNIAKSKPLIIEDEAGNE